MLENWLYLSYDKNVKQVGSRALEVTIGNCQTTEQRKIPLL